MYQKKTEIDSKKLPIGFLQKMIDEVANIYNLPNDHKIRKTLIWQRISTAKHHVPYGQGNGFPYPLMKIDDEVCNLIIAISKFHHTIIVSNALKLINYII